MKIDDLSIRQKNDLASCFAYVASQKLDLNITDVALKFFKLRHIYNTN